MNPRNEPCSPDDVRRALRASRRATALHGAALYASAWCYLPVEIIDELEIDARLATLALEQVRLHASRASE